MSLRIALTGGIGAGKSTVAAGFASRGAFVLDADEFARACLADDVVAGEVAAIAPEASTAAGGIDRQRLAQAIFTDPRKRHAVEEVMHPWIRAAMSAAAARAEADSDQTVVLEIPLLVESRSPADINAEFDAVVTVEAPEEIRVRRLVARGMSDGDARARMAAQPEPGQRARVATIVIDNSGDEMRLNEQIASAWATLSSMVDNGDR